METTLCQKQSTAVSDVYRMCFSTMQSKLKISVTVVLLLAVCVKDGQIVGIILCNACSLVKGYCFFSVVQVVKVSAIALAAPALLVKPE